LLRSADVQVTRVTAARQTAAAHSTTRGGRRHQTPAGCGTCSMIAGESLHILQRLITDPRAID
jgi:hypothetical protein